MLTNILKNTVNDDDEKGSVV